MSAMSSATKSLSDTESEQLNSYKTKLKSHTCSLIYSTAPRRNERRLSQVVNQNGDKFQKVFKRLRFFQVAKFFRRTSFCDVLIQVRKYLKNSCLGILIV